ncbi:glycosyltransferase [Bradyrhizobium quebecense]|uniref:Glycosyltransferase n=1 Tax=Bradyrhizobium quebecense TaxID=2748629 RepID=A0A973WJW2_9BRAD|nr:glycosyltransferase [Bradyrhizobium quebecense]UGA48308.1 glycosyltransferase [Bradyrhizobium quebecense]
MNKIEPIGPTSLTEAPLPADDVASSRPAQSAIADFVTRVLVRAARRATEKRLAKGKVRTLWASTPILTLPLLARCDRMLGFRSSSLVFNTYYVTRSFDINLILFEGFLRLLRSRRGLGLFRHLVLGWALLRYDFFNYFYDRGLMLSDGRYGINPEELDLLFRSGKRLYTYAYGADVRAREPTLELGHPNLCEECPAPGKFCVCTTEMHASSINRLKGRATAQIAMGDMVTYVPGCRDMHYWPIDASKLAARPPVYKAGDVLRVAHAPNHGHFKGTRLLIEAIDRLVKEGEKIELVSVQGVPNKKVIELFGASHVVADQFVAGFHGYTALEAMAMAKPVLCFLRDDRMMVDPATCPIINTRPDEIYHVLKRCLRGELDLNDIGQAGRRYVEAHYSLQAVAARLGRLYCETADLPEDLRASLARQVSKFARDNHAS